MLDTQSFYTKLDFFDSTKTPVTSAVTSNSYKVDYNYEALTLEVSGATGIDLTVEGCINTKKNNKELSDTEITWTPLATINTHDFTIADKITKNGIYTISLDGIIKIRIKVSSVTGNATIVGVMGR